jgi:hypothetical protein
MTPAPDLARALQLVADHLEHSLDSGDRGTRAATLREVGRRLLDHPDSYALFGCGAWHRAVRRWRFVAGRASGVRTPPDAAEVERLHGAALRGSELELCKCIPSQNFEPSPPLRSA